MLKKETFEKIDKVVAEWKNVLIPAEAKREGITLEETLDWYLGDEEAMDRALVDTFELAGAGLSKEEIEFSEEIYNEWVNRLAIAFGVEVEEYWLV